MQPLQTGTQVFSADQQIGFRVDYWDTVMTVPQKGISYALFDILDERFTLSDVTTVAAADNRLKGTQVSAVLGKNQDGSLRMGLVPNLYQYWGGGAPAGVKNARRVAMKYSGTVQESGTTTLVFGGSGQVLVFVNGSVVVNGRVQEPKPDLDVLAQATIKEAEIETLGGYQIHTLSLTAGQTVDIYYWQNGEPWGGFFCKAIPGAVTFPVSWTSLRRKLRDAMPVSASMISAGALTPVELPYVERVDVRRTKNAITALEITVAVAESGGPDGFAFETVNDETYLIDNATGVKFKANRRVYFEGGYVQDGTEEFYARFSGHIDRIEATDEFAVIHCMDYGAKLAGHYDENHPDFVAYQANGFIDRRWMGYPVWGIPAFDAWPMESAFAELCYRAGIDGYNLGKSPYVEQPDHGKPLYRTRRTGLLQAGINPYFWARSLNAKDADGTRLPIYLQRQSNYGNVGIKRQENLPRDDEYLYPPEITRRLWDRVLALSEHFGYDFEFTPHGQCSISPRNNPTVFVPFVPEN